MQEPGNDAEESQVDLENIFGEHVDWYVLSFNSLITIVWND